MASLKERLQEILIRDQIITPAQLEAAIEEQKKFGGELSKILVKLNFISEDQLTNLLSEGLGLPLMNINRLKVPAEVIGLIPQDVAVKYKILPVARIGDHLTLAMIDPLDIFALDNVKALTGLVVNPVVGRTKDIVKAISTYYSTDSNVVFEKIIKDIKDTEDLELVKEGHKNLAKNEIESLTQDAPIIKLTNTIIQQAVVAKASDVFIEPMEDSLRIRYRIDGMLREIDRMSKVLHFPIISRLKVISSLDISEHRLPQDGRFKMVTSDNKEVDFRVSVLPTAMGEKIVLRVLDKNLEMLDMSKLGFEPPSMQRLKDSCVRPHGLILACGPTGSGKTTTLYSILKFVDSPGKNIVTVEDPVEYQMKGFNQVNIRAEVGLSFTASLRSILRQDPDVIMIGEVRDSETLDIAVKAALTGHLVVSSLHTTTASGSITRMINMGVEPFLITSSLICIIAQRLLRRICAKCKEEYAVPDVLYERLMIGSIVPGKDKKFFRGKGCPHCFNTGYYSRVGITEIMALTPRIREAILSDASEISLKNLARKEGMATMREDGIMKACHGLTTLEEVVRVTAPDEPLK
ncbi:MAG: Flp pilus assembly complex ATPase component TadA [Candidatus Omnitrophica bacterium]|nr:Flp pilus assembly complex ATPase component TadA [Candidatus Omnitrophota bacterium]